MVKILRLDCQHRRRLSGSASLSLLVVLVEFELVLPRFVDVQYVASAARTLSLKELSQNLALSFSAAGYPIDNMAMATAFEVENVSAQPQQEPEGSATTLAMGFAAVIVCVPITAVAAAHLCKTGKPWQHHQGKVHAIASMYEDVKVGQLEAGTSTTDLWAMEQVPLPPVARKGFFPPLPLAGLPSWQSNGGSAPEKRSTPIAVQAWGSQADEEGPNLLSEPRPKVSASAPLPTLLRSRPAQAANQPDCAVCIISTPHMVQPASNATLSATSTPVASQAERFTLNVSKPPVNPWETLLSAPRNVQPASDAMWAAKLAPTASSGLAQPASSATGAATLTPTAPSLRSFAQSSRLRSLAQLAEPPPILSWHVRQGINLDPEWYLSSSPCEDPCGSQSLVHQESQMQRELTRVQKTLACMRYDRPACNLPGMPDTRKAELRQRQQDLHQQLKEIRAGLAVAKSEHGRHIITPPLRNSSLSRAAVGRHHLISAA